jgi:hypothetical protein
VLEPALGVVLGVDGRALQISTGLGEGHRATSRQRYANGVSLSFEARHPGQARQLPRGDQSAAQGRLDLAGDASDREASAESSLDRVVASTQQEEKCYRFRRQELAPVFLGLRLALRLASHWGCRLGQPQERGAARLGPVRLPGPACHP